MSPFQKALIWYGGISFVAGCAFTSCAFGSDNEQPPPQIEERIVTEEKEVEVEVEVPYLPESCRLAIDYALNMFDSAADLSATAGEQVEILTEVNKFIASDDMQVHNENIQRQRDLMDTSLEWLAPLSDNDAQLKAFSESCRKDLE